MFLKLFDEHSYRDVYLNCKFLINLFIFLEVKFRSDLLKSFLLSKSLDSVNSFYSIK